LIESIKALELERSGKFGREVWNVEVSAGSRKKFLVFDNWIIMVEKKASESRFFGSRAS
jgi:hypothetical protein